MKFLMTLILGGALFCSGQALAGDLCKQFTVKFRNLAGTTVKVTRFQYRDYDKDRTRTERIAGVLKVCPSASQRAAWRCRSASP